MGASHSKKSAAANYVGEGRHQFEQESILAAIAVNKRQRKQLIKQAKLSRQQALAEKQSRQPALMLCSNNNKYLSQHCYASCQSLYGERELGIETTDDYLAPGAESSSFLNHPIYLPAARSEHNLASRVNLRVASSGKTTSSAGNRLHQNSGQTRYRKRRLGRNNATRALNQGGIIQQPFAISDTSHVSPASRDPRRVAPMTIVAAATERSQSEDEAYFEELDMASEGSGETFVVGGGGGDDELGGELRQSYGEYRVAGTLPGEGELAAAGGPSGLLGWRASDSTGSSIVSGVGAAGELHAKSNGRRRKPSSEASASAPNPAKTPAKASSGESGRFKERRQITETAHRRPHQLRQPQQRNGRVQGKTARSADSGFYQHNTTDWAASGHSRKQEAFAKVAALAEQRFEDPPSASSQATLSLALSEPDGCAADDTLVAPASATATAMALKQLSRDTLVIGGARVLPKSHQNQQTVVLQQRRQFLASKGAGQTPASNSKQTRLNNNTTSSKLDLTAASNSRSSSSQCSYQSSSSPSFYQSSSLGQQRQITTTTTTTTVASGKQHLASGGHQMSSFIQPRYQRGLAYTESERVRLGLLGLLPAAVQDLDLQVRAVMNFIDHCPDELSRYVYLRQLKDFNERLFYASVMRHVERLMPIVYTPTVGLACQRFSEIYMRPRGLFIGAADLGRVASLLANWPEKDVRVIVVTDGERILGLGDLGANGMGISIGKLSLYTALAGIPPENVLPITLDVGTNNQTLLKDPFYIGLRETRIRGATYDALIEEFMEAVALRWGRSCLIQFEDFANSNAFVLLNRYRNRYCTFNDDIQGTASVCLSGLLSAARLIGRRLADCTFLFYGAGEANLGTAQLLIMAMLEEGASKTEAQKRIWLIDSKGLVVSSRTDLSEHKRSFAQVTSEANQLKDLEQIVEFTKPTAIIGASAQGGAFTEAVCRKMAALNERPIIFALSNPTSKAECTADQAYRWTEGRCVFASGSPFEPVVYNGKSHITGQGNNAYIFPGVGLAAIAAHVHTIPEDTFLVAARALSDQLSDTDSAVGLVYPRLSKIREVTLKVATRVLEHFYSERLATYRPEPDDKMSFLRSIQYDCQYNDRDPNTISLSQMSLANANKANGNSH